MYVYINGVGGGVWLSDLADALTDPFARQSVE